MVIEFDSSCILSKKEREERSVRVLVSIRIQDSMTKNNQQYMQPSRSTSVKIRKRTLSQSRNQGITPLITCTRSRSELGLDDAKVRRVGDIAK
jgi:hypothetical protein